MNQDGKNDYTTGLNLDLGRATPGRFTALNVEGAGFGGWYNLLHDASDFGAVRRLAVRRPSGRGGVRLFADGKLNGKRDRGDSMLRMDDFWSALAAITTRAAPPTSAGFLSCADPGSPYLRPRPQRRRTEEAGRLSRRPAGQDHETHAAAQADHRQAVRSRRRPAAGADTRPRLRRPAAAHRLAQHQQRPLSARRQTRRPRLQRRYLSLIG